VLPSYRGVIIRDGYAGYMHFTDAQHAWCRAHTLRDVKLMYDADPERQTGLAAMRDSLLLMLQAIGTARAHGTETLEAKDLSLYRACYAGAVNQMRLDNRERTEPVADAARTLATRFETRREMILRFLVDLAVPFTNNGSEREIRPVKIHQRSSGGAWWTLDGLADFATIWSYLITAAKHGVGQLEALTILFEGNLAAAGPSFSLCLICDFAVSGDPGLSPMPPARRAVR
jgi:transposase